mmetsp:Transcript_30828/g.67315  ORF Transcript_30828/g.67315 Transcript_30828/m.67315 type:complete len:269 (-) Transcript_30828:1156-1962(-)
MGWTVKAEARYGPHVSADDTATVRTYQQRERYLGGVLYKRGSGTLKLTTTTVAKLRAAPLSLLRLLLHEELPRIHLDLLRLRHGRHLIKLVPPPAIAHGELVVRNREAPGVPAPLHAVLLPEHQPEVLAQHLVGHRLPHQLDAWDETGPAEEVEGHAVEQAGVALLGGQVDVQLVEVLLAVLALEAALDLPGLVEPDGGEGHHGREEGHVDGVRVPVPRQLVLQVELHRVGDGPAAGKGGGVCEGGVREVQQVLDEKAVLDGHVQHDL